MLLEAVTGKRKKQLKIPLLCRIEIVNLQKMTLLHRPATANMQFLSR